MFNKFAVIACLVLVIGGCTIQPKDMANGAQNKATLYPSGYVAKNLLLANEFYYAQIVAVDNREVDGVWWLDRFPVYVTPGDHVLKVRAIDMPGGSVLANWSANRHANNTLRDMHVSVEPDKSYVIEVSATFVPQEFCCAPEVAYEFSIAPFIGTSMPTKDMPELLRVPPAD